jgi:hypothetical protein
MKYRAVMLAIPGLLLMISGCDGGGASGRVANEDLVYLTIRYDLTQALCGERRALTRIGGDGAIASPKTSDGQFVIPPNRSFILTDIHMAYGNDTTAPREQSFALYNLGAAGEVVIWTGGVVAAPNSSAYYERALSTGIRIAAPAQICVAFSDQQHPPAIVLTGYLQ